MDTNTQGMFKCADANLKHMGVTLHNCGLGLKSVIMFILLYKCGQCVKGNHGSF